eukprot:c14388_g1_i1.p1 GENE.c14388_g1_i1~~c14388_g1_i1.p1  ORF type:complete len:425 (-),score=158.30 c14388_g1_i1:21-1211(-)
MLNIGIEKEKKKDNNTSNNGLLQIKGKDNDGASHRSLYTAKGQKIRRRDADHISDITKDFDVLLQAENEKQCTYLIKEMASTESAYVTSLENLKKAYQVPLSQLKNAKALNIDEIFVHIDPILINHISLKNKLHEILELPRPLWPNSVASTLISAAPTLRECSPFIERFNNILEIVNEIAKDKKVQKIFEQAREMNLLDIQSYLIMPVQRIPRLELLLRDLLKRTNRKQPEYEMIEKAMKDVKEVVLFCNSRKRAVDSENEISQVLLQVKNIPFEFDKEGRKLEYKGKLKAQVKGRLISTSTFLFNDLILWSTYGNNVLDDSLSYCGHAFLSKGTFKVLPTTQEELLNSKIRLPKSREIWKSEFGFTLKFKNEEIIFIARTDEEKNIWTEKIKSTI